MGRRRRQKSDQQQGWVQACSRRRRALSLAPTLLCSRVVRAHVIVRWPSVMRTVVGHRDACGRTAHKHCHCCWCRTLPRALARTSAPPPRSSHTRGDIPYSPAVRLQLTSHVLRELAVSAACCRNSAPGGGAQTSSKARGGAVAWAAVVLRTAMNPAQNKASLLL